MKHPIMITELIEKLKLELTEKSKKFSKEEVNSFYECMKIEYKNYMMMSREETLQALSKFKTILY